MLRDNLVELIEPMLNSAGANPLALTHHQIQASGDRLPCLENPRPKGAESSLTENAPSPFQAEPAHYFAARHYRDWVLCSFCLGLRANALDGPPVLHRAISDWNSYGSHGDHNIFLVCAQVFRAQSL